MTTQVANEVGIACTRSVYVWVEEAGTAVDHQHKFPQVLVHHFVVFTN